MPLRGISCAMQVVAVSSKDAIRSGLKSNRIIVYRCKYHIVECPKYRRKALVNGVAERFKEIIDPSAAKQRVEIIESCPFAV